MKEKKQAVVPVIQRFVPILYNHGQKQYFCQILLFPSKKNLHHQKAGTGRVSIATDFDKCGTTLITDEGSITLSNSLKHLSNPVHELLKFKPTHILDITCSYQTTFTAKGPDFI